MSRPVWSVEYYFLPVADESGFGVVLQGAAGAFAGIEPGESVRVVGAIQRRNGMPVLVPRKIEKSGRRASVQIRTVKPGDLGTFRYLGLVVATEGRIVASAENSAGELLTVEDRGGRIVVFQPRLRQDDEPSLIRIRVGDQVRVTGILVQDCPLPPFDRYFQILSPGAESVLVLQAAAGIPAYLLLTALTAIGVLLIVWWFRENRLAGFRRTMQTLNALGEDVLASNSMSDILKKIETAVPSIVNASGVTIFLYNRQTRMLEPVRSAGVRSAAAHAPQPIDLDEPGSPMSAGVAMCFRNRTLLNIPDTRRSPFFKADARSGVPRSVMFVPMFAQTELLGVLQVHRRETLRYFSSEEQAAAQHLANQLATSLKLQEQRSMREQLFKSEKLAATGQLISEVANELKEPVETMLVLSQVALRRSGQMQERDLQLLASESQRTAEIVARLISFGRNHEEIAARPVEINGLLAGLFEFREREWKAIGLRLLDRLSADPVYVLGSQGQMEQVLLNLLVHAEQTLAETDEKSLTVSVNRMGRRVMVDITYSARVSSPDPFSEGQAAMGLGVARGIVQGHGGDLRFERPGTNTCRFNVELPLADVGSASGASHAPSGRRSAEAVNFTMLLVEPDVASQRQTVTALAARGHRVVPVKTAEEALDLAQRVRFDAVVCSARLSGQNWITFYQQVQANVEAFILLTEGFDASLAQAFSNGNGFFLTKPLEDHDIDRVLESVAHHLNDPAVASVK